MRFGAGFEVDPPTGRHQRAPRSWWRPFLIAVVAVLVGLLSAPIVAPVARAQSLRTTAYDALSTGYGHPASPVHVDGSPVLRRGLPIEPSAASVADYVSGSWIGVAAKALPGLPKALSGGAEDTYVYFGTRNGKNVYTGITNNLERRGAQHGERFDYLDQITDAPVTRGQARAIEQAMIARNPGFENKINSISPNHSYYDDAVSWGEAWFRQNGY